MTQPQIVVVTEPQGGSTVVVRESDSQITASDVGVQGEPGPIGPASGEHKFHVQTEPSTMWVFPHNLGYRPNVAVLDVNGYVITDAVIVRHDDENQVSVHIGEAIAGRIECS